MSGEVEGHLDIIVGRRLTLRAQMMMAGWPIGNVDDFVMFRLESGTASSTPLLVVIKLLNVDRTAYFKTLIYYTFPCSRKSV